MPDTILVAYASRFGTCRRIAERVCAAATAAGHTATLLDVATAPEALDADVTRVVAIGAVYSNQHDGPLLTFLTRHASALAGKRNALISVSLAAAIPTDEGEAMALDYVDELGKITGFRPKDIATIPGALDESQYDAPTAALLRVAVWRRELNANGDVSFVNEAEIARYCKRWFGAPR